MHLLHKVIAQLKTAGDVGRSRLGDKLKATIEGIPVEYVVHSLDGYPEGGNLQSDLTLTVGEDPIRIEHDGWEEYWDGELTDNIKELTFGLDPITAEFLSDLVDPENFSWELIQDYAKQTGASEQRIGDWIALHGPVMVGGALTGNTSDDELLEQDAGIEQDYTQPSFDDYSDDYNRETK